MLSQPVRRPARIVTADKTPIIPASLSARRGGAPLHGASDRGEQSIGSHLSTEPQAPQRSQRPASRVPSHRRTGSFHSTPLILVSDVLDQRCSAIDNAEPSTVQVHLSNGAAPFIVPTYTGAL